MSAALEVREADARYLAAEQPALVKQFELLATAPGGVKRLRELILTLAVQGKLVPQVPEDEPASELLSRVLTQKAQLVSAGKIKAAKPFSKVAEEDQPFKLPASWTCARFGDVTINRDGERIPVSSSDRERREKIYDYYGASGVIDKIDGYLFDKTLLLIGEDGANLLNRSTPIAFLAHGKYWVNNHAHVIDTTEPGLMRYLELFINAISLDPYVTGTAQPKMNQAKLNSIVVALPPLNEQARIVARVDELMRLCDALEAKGRLDAQQHARLLGTLLGTLTDSSTPEELAANWQRVADHFDLLLDRPEAVDALEQTIFQMAVRGLLVSQSPTDAPAHVLLEQLRLEKDQRIATGTLKREKSGPPVGADEEPFALPSGWRWERLVNLANFIDYRGKTPTKTASGVPLITAKNVRQGFIDREPREFIAAEAYASWMTRGLPEVGDILITTEAPLGNVATIELVERFALAQRVICLSLYERRSAEALSIFLRSPWFQAALAAQSSGVTAQGIKSSRLQMMPIPVPPLAEQQRIAARVAELRRLCADLRQRLTESRTTQTHLAEALVDSIP